MPLTMVYAIDCMMVFSISIAKGGHHYEIRTAKKRCERYSRIVPFLRGIGMSG